MINIYILENFVKGGNLKQTRVGSSSTIQGGWALANVITRKSNFQQWVYWLNTRPFKSCVLLVGIVFKNSFFIKIKKLFKIYLTDCF